MLPVAAQGLFAFPFLTNTEKMNLKIIKAKMQIAGYEADANIHNKGYSALLFQYA